MQNLVDLMAVAMFPVLVGIPHTTLLYLFSSSAFLKTAQLISQKLPRGSSQLITESVTKTSKNPAAEEGSDKFARPGHVSVNNLKHVGQTPTNASVDALVDQAVLAYGQQNRGTLRARLPNDSFPCNVALMARPSLQPLLLLR